MSQGQGFYLTLCTPGDLTPMGADFISAARDVLDDGGAPTSSASLDGDRFLMSSQSG